MRFNATEWENFKRQPLGTKITFKLNQHVVRSLYKPQASKLSLLVIVKQEKLLASD